MIGAKSFRGLLCERRRRRLCCAFSSSTFRTIFFFCSLFLAQRRKTKKGEERGSLLQLRRNVPASSCRNQSVGFGAFFVALMLHAGLERCAATWPRFLGVKAWRERAVLLRKCDELPQRDGYVSKSPLSFRASRLGSFVFFFSFLCVCVCVCVCFPASTKRFEVVTERGMTLRTTAGKTKAWS
jgi:hypothetical protein